MLIGEQETEINGSYLFDGKRIVADESCLRIEWLIKNHLQVVATDVSGWEILYLDNVNGSYWEKIFLQGELQGGGPPSLIQISEATAKSKYNI